MALPSHTEAIIRLAWCRRLGLPDDALEPSDLDLGADPRAQGSARIELERDEPGGAGLVRLWDATVLIGPAALIEAAHDHADDELLDAALVSRLLGRAGVGPGPRAGEVTVLSYADDYFSAGPGEPPLISAEPSDALALEQRCPPDDRIGLDFAALPSRFVLLDEDDEQRPVAGAGYSEAGPLLARLAVLVPPGHRRRGLGRRVATIAVNDALDAGLVVESAVADGNAGARGLSESLGFTGVGCRITFPL